MSEFRDERGRWSYPTRDGDKAGAFPTFSQKFNVETLHRMDRDLCEAYATPVDEDGPQTHAEVASVPVDLITLLNLVRFAQAGVAAETAKASKERV